MFKKTTLLGSILLVSACSSNTASTDYVNDVVVQKNAQESYIETVGKDIVPVDLLELNLGLKMSVLSVTAKTATDAKQTKPELEQPVNVQTTQTNTVESETTAIEPTNSDATSSVEQNTIPNAHQNTDSLQSDVFFEIQYKQDKDETNKETFNQYNVALVDGMNVELVANKASQHCGDKECVVSQSFSFPVDSTLLENSTIDGLKFSLLETTNNDKLVLETMIPGRYITALLAK